MTNLILIITAIAVFVVLAYIALTKHFSKEEKLPLIPFDPISYEMGVPIINLCQGEKVFKFMLDTGSGCSIIDIRQVGNIKCYKQEEKDEIYGIDGSYIKTDVAIAKFSFDSIEIADKFKVTEIGAFDNMKINRGVEVCGLLGSSFFKRYEVLIDFQKLNLIIGRNRFDEARRTISLGKQKS